MSDYVVEIVLYEVSFPLERTFFHGKTHVGDIGKKEVVSQLYGKFAFFSAMVSFRAGSPCFRVPRFCSYRYRQEKGLADPVVNRGR